MSSAMHAAWDASTPSIIPSCGSPLYWTGCYRGDSFKRYVTPESYAHPAKMAWGLANRIFTHLEALGLLRRGMKIVDFMAGSGRTSVVAALRGYESVSVELEPHFIRMIEANKQRLTDMVNGGLPEWTVIQGDAWRLSELLGGGGVGVVSPPYAKEEHHRQNKMMKKMFEGRSYVEGVDYGYAGVVSPPYSEAQTGAGVMNHTQPCSCAHCNKMRRSWDGYDKRFAGGSAGQIGSLPDRVGIVSPPYEDGLGHGGLHPTDIDRKKHLDSVTRSGFGRGNVGAGETYLSAMKAVYEQAYISGLSPLVIITKNPTRNGKLRRLDLDTANLVEAAGVDVSLVTVLFVDNVGDILHVCNLADELHAKKLKILTPIRKGRGEKMVSRGLSSSELGRLHDFIKDEKQKAGWKVRITITDWGLVDEGHALLIHPDGDIVASPVPSNASCVRGVGNLKENSLDSIWNNYPYKENHLRKYLEESLYVC